MIILINFHENKMSWKCYLLKAETGQTYVGATIDCDRRLRQHNGELCGGARATRGKTWVRIGYVDGFPDNHTALSFEWKWKYLSRKCKGHPLERRLIALNTLLSLERPTSKSIRYSDYPNGLPVVHIESS